MSSLTITDIRSRFPALSQPQVFMDNAGGSQVLGSVIESMTTYLRTTNVQLGASYPISRQSTAKFSAGHEAGARYINARHDQVVFGPSTTQHFRNVSTALRTREGDEIVISKLDHEANVAGWLQMAKWRGLKVVWWHPREVGKGSVVNPRLVPEDLRGLVNERTRLVACTHTSNILGGVTDLRALAEVVRAGSGGRALLAADAVAFAPHGKVDVQELGVDIYSFSWYKVYGPHCAMLYISDRARGEIETLGHFFKSTNTLEEMLGLAAGSYEAVQAVPKIIEYIDEVGWDAIAKQEEEIQEVLLKYLRSKPDIIKIYGEPSCDRKLRVPVISFRVKGQSSLSIIDAIEAKSNFGCRNGHFYSKRLCEEVLKIPDADDGVIRCSLLHYNTVEEVDGLVKVLDEVIQEGAATVKDEGRNDISNW